MTERKTLVLGIGNLLMGDEGVGVEVVRRVESEELPVDVECLDGGTGGFTLLGPVQDARRVILIDATADGGAAGSVRRLRPRFSSDYPRTLSAHDIGLKDLLDALFLLGDPPDVTLFAVSIEFPQPMGIGLSEAVAAAVPSIVEQVLRETNAGQAWAKPASGV
jgi:hydrogenase maturation protease